MRRSVLNAIYAILAYTAGFMLAMAGIYVILKSRMTHDLGGGLIAVGTAVFLVYGVMSALFGALLLTVTVLTDRWVLHRLAPLQGVLVAIAGVPAMLTLERVLPSPIALLGSGSVVLLPWLLYLPARAAHMRRAASGSTRRT